MHRLRQFSSQFLFVAIFAVILLLHWPLLRLPFFWDEAGFYIPAAHDLLRLHALIPRTTMDTGHPPLPAAYLALWFAVAGLKPAVARVAQLLLAAFALTNVFLLARRVANLPVAIASTIATAAYSIFFVQSSLAHADLMAAAFTLWGLRLRFEDRRGFSQLAFSLAVLSKETAVITPLALALWEVWQRTPGRMRRTVMSLVPVLPLAAWLAYHHYATGRFFGNAEFYQYNVAAAITPLRFLLALGLRAWHLLGTMNMAALTAAMLVAMRFPPVVDRSGPRERIAVAVQMQFFLVMLAYVITFSLLGGALLTRYLLPAYPLLIIIAMSTLRRRILSWEWPAAILVIFFVLALFFDPPYRFAPEDNLTYRDFVELHAHAANFLEQHEQGLTVLTAWPANDELSKPYLGYVTSPMTTLTVPNFTPEEVIRAKQESNRFQVAYLFSTKYETSTWFRSAVWEKLNRRFFDYHTDLSPEAAAELLGCKVVYLEQRKAEWVEIIEMEQPASVAQR
ncbi:MAG TPA: glycosyltransferase family 39 protein [Terriglobales bacterium]|nr:glycosyltransferase family 39 protein [Terriglobales bacterium]